MRIRLSTPADILELSAVIPLSARTLSRGFYTEREAESAIRYIFGVDTQLVEDQSDFVVEGAGARAPHPHTSVPPA
jgi:hypothetical protein